MTWVQWQTAAADALTPAVIESGGFTVHPFTGKTPRTGYQVGGDPTLSVRIPLDSLTDDTRQRTLAHAILAIRNAGAHLFRPHSRWYLGGWVQDGCLWLEPSERVDTLAQALRLGAERSQLAIWDNARAREIPVPNAQPHTHAA